MIARVRYDNAKLCTFILNLLYLVKDVTYSLMGTSCPLANDITDGAREVRSSPSRPHICV